MTPDERELLVKTYKLSEENNKILKGIRRAHRWSAFFRVLYWAIIIGVSVGAFYYLQPYLTAVLDAYQNIQNNLQGINSAASNLPDVSGLIDKLK